MPFILNIMNFARIILIVLIFSLLFSCQQKTSIPNETSESIYDGLVRKDDRECEKQNIQIVSLLTELAKIRTSDKSFMQTDSAKIRLFVEKVKDKEDLFDLAKILKILERNSSNDECFQNNLMNVYSHAFWDCIEILAEDRSDGNLATLERLKKEIRISGGDSYNWSTIVYRVPQP